MSEIFLRPFSQNHSIREAVISIFLVNPIIKPERFEQLISNGFNDDFHLYEATNAVQIQFKQNANGFSPQPEQQPNIGFRFLGFANGKIGRMLQGTNDLNRTFISYHSFAYTRWNQFLDDYLKYLKIITNFQSDIFVRAVSVHYIDELNWISNSAMDLTKVFNDEAKYMSKAFLESSNTSNFMYSTEKTDSSNCLTMDRLEIKVDNKNNKNIIISHNITKQFNDFENLSTLIDSDQSFFKSSLQDLHNYNKKILSDILNENVKTLINLPTEQL